MKKFDKKFIENGIEEFMGMIDCALETCREHDEGSWNTIWKMDGVNHKELIEEFEKQVLIGVSKKLLEEYKGYKIFIK